jgi:TonB-dependent starch-binding outer membrane protein SusC
MTAQLNMTLSTNFTWLKNEVTFLNPLLDRVGGTTVGTGWTATYLELNQPVWFFRGYQTNGIFQNQAEIDAYKAANGGLAGYNPVPGDPIVVNTNGDNLINNEDQTSIGSPHPKFMWGAYLNFHIQDSICACLQGVHGQDVFWDGIVMTDQPPTVRSFSLMKDGQAKEALTKDQEQINQAHTSITVI